MKGFQMFCFVFIGVCCMQLQCEKDFPCRIPGEKKSTGVQIDKVSASYNIGDTIRISQTLPYSFFSGFSTHPDSLRKVYGYFFYTILQLFTPSGDSNARVAGNSFRHIYLRDSLSQNVHAEYYSLKIYHDSIHLRFETRLNLIPLQTGSYAIYIERHNIRREGSSLCNGQYEWNITPFWDVPDNNRHIPTNLGIGTIKYKQISNLYFAHRDKSDPSIYFFTVQ